MKVQYIRFIHPVMSPGRGGNTITKAMTGDGVMVRRDEKMSDIEISDRCITLTAPTGARRVVSLTNYIDAEPLDALEAKKK